MVAILFEQKFTAETAAVQCNLHRNCCIDLKWSMIGQYRLLLNMISDGVLFSLNNALYHQQTLNEYFYWSFHWVVTLCVIFNDSG